MNARHLLKGFVWLMCLFLTTLSSYAAHNKALFKGAQVYMNYCVGCHALKYVRYSRLASDLNLDEKSALKANLLNTKAQWNDSILVALSAKEAARWFGAVPPDLSLVAKEKGLTWLRQYLKGFYPDAHRPFGTNNRLVPNVAMPDILPVSFKENTIEDLLEFLAYVAEPNYSLRYTFAILVFPFLLVLFLLLWRLKRLYWQSIH